jgi:NitT/TauT family transport system ATP-binding protein
VSNFDITLECDRISHAFGTNRVLFDVNLKIARGQIVSLVGPSGCGKSTLLRAQLGTHLPQEGAVRVNGQVVRGPGRDRGIVYQQYALYPFLTARQNVALGPTFDRSTFPERVFGYFAWRKKRKELMDEAGAILERYGLGRALDLYPHEMSGGMRQRVALAQSVIMKPEILFLDEPFGALDEATREELQMMLLELYAENVAAAKQGTKPPYTIVIVTHELNEALYVADRIVGLSQYWAWEEEGHTSRPGATIVYDTLAPVFHPGSVREYEHFVEQRQEIRNVVFAEDVRQPRGRHVDFWSRVRAGEAHGVLAP